MCKLAPYCINHCTVNRVYFSNRFRISTSSTAQFLPKRSSNEFPRLHAPLAIRASIFQNFPFVSHIVTQHRGRYYHASTVLAIPEVLESCQTRKRRVGNLWCPQRAGPHMPHYRTASTMQPQESAVPSGKLLLLLLQMFVLLFYYSPVSSEAPGSGRISVWQCS